MTTHHRVPTCARVMSSGAMVSCWRPSLSPGWVLSSSSTRPLYATVVSYNIEGRVLGGLCPPWMQVVLHAVSYCTHSGLGGSISLGTVEGEEAGSEAG